MDKRDYAIIGLLLVIIAMLSYNVINAYNDAQPEVFEFSDYIVTAPPGTHYHNDSGQRFFLSEKDVNEVFTVNSSFMKVEYFDELYNSLKNGSVSKSDAIKMMNEMEENDTFLDINIGDFRGEPEISVVVQNPNNSSQKGMIHLIKHNNDKIFAVGGYLNNDTATQMYNSLLLK